MKSEYRNVPQLLVEGVAPDGRKFDLSGIFGEWISTRTEAEMLALYQRSHMNAPEAQAFWQWWGRNDPPPKRLRIWLRVNPEFVNWILLGKAAGFVQSKIEISDEELKAEFLRAFRAEHIRTRNTCIEHKTNAEGTPVAVYQVEVNTRDFVKWLDYEHDIKTTKHAVACHPGDPTVIDALSQPRRRKKNKPGDTP
jgi:hypothetical protein